MIRILLFLFMVHEVVAQVQPRLEIYGSFTSIAQANGARSIITNKLAEVRNNSIHVLDSDFVTSTNTGTVVVNAVIGFRTTNLLNAATTWFQTNSFPGQGWTLRINSHLCLTNTATSDWLGCNLDPRARHFETVITP